MIVIGIESTAHTFGVGAVDEKGNVLANETDSYKTESGGMLLDQVAKHHEEVADGMIEKVLDRIGLEGVEIVAYAAGPGLTPALLVGFDKAKKLAARLGKPLVGINHCAAHLSIGEITTGTKNPVFLYVSGVNTQVISYEGGKFRILGETLDVGLGNALDKFGRDIGLGFPAGAKIEEMARRGKYIVLPYTVKGMDVSFSGILTKVQNLYKKGASPEDLCFSFQETAFAMMAEVAERAMAHLDKQELLLVGGVAANKKFCEMLQIMCEERGAKFFKCPAQYCGDQGAMIAWEGLIRFKEKRFITDIDPYWRVDEV